MKLKYARDGRVRNQRGVGSEGMGRRSYWNGPEIVGVPQLFHVKPLRPGAGPVGRRST